MAEYQVIDINGLDHYDSKLKEQIRTKLDNYYTKNEANAKFTYFEGEGISISNDNKISTNLEIEPSNPTLNYGETSDIGSIGGKVFSVTMPDAPEAPVSTIDFTADNDPDQGYSTSNIRLAGGEGISTELLYGENLSEETVSDYFGEACRITFNLAKATDSTLGGIKVSSVNNDVVTVNTESSIEGRYYPVELTNTGLAIVNVPWKDTDQDTGVQLEFIDASGNKIYNTTGSSLVTFVEGNGISFQYDDWGIPDETGSPTTSGIFITVSTNRVSNTDIDALFTNNPL